MKGERNVPNDSALKRNYTLFAPVKGSHNG